MSQIPESIRKLRASMGGDAVAAKHDPRAPGSYTQPGRDAFLLKFLDQVDPKRVLPEKERIRRAEAAKRLYMTGLSLKSIQVRRKAAQARGDRQAAPWRAAEAAREADAEEGGE